MSESARIETYEIDNYRFLKYDGIVHTHAKQEKDDVESMTAYFDMLVQINGTSGYVLVDPTENKSFSEDARKLVINWLNENDYVVAVIVKSKLSKIVFTFMTTVLSINFEMKAFTEVEAAKKWLLEKRKRDLDAGIER